MNTNNKSSRKLSPVQYSRALVKIAIGQILQTIGFQAAQSTAIEILAEVLERYVLLLGKTAHDFAELGSHKNRKYFFKNLVYFILQYL
jgi:histone H3/H4